MERLIYRILFDSDPIVVPDPNKEENIPRIKAENQKTLDNLQRFWNGSGKPLMNRWKDRLRVGIHEILLSEDKCNCALSIKKRELATIIRMLAEAESILTKE